MQGEETHRRSKTSEAADEHILRDSFSCSGCLDLDQATINVDANAPGIAEPEGYGLTGHGDVPLHGLADGVQQAVPGIRNGPGPRHPANLHISDSRSWLEGKREVGPDGQAVAAVVH